MLEDFTLISFIKNFDLSFYSEDNKTDEIFLETLFIIWKSLVKEAESHIVIGLLGLFFLFFLLLFCYKTKRLQSIIG